MGLLLEQLRKPRWSPYVAGVLLGLVYILGLLFADQLLGASGSFENLAGLIAGFFSPKVSDNVYFQYVMPPGITWQVWLLVGVFLGALVSSLSSGSFKWRAVPVQWEKDYGKGRAKRWILAFIGGIILEFGAGIAGGCTSGLAIAGSLQLAPAGFIFIAGLFASGVITSLLVYRGRWH